MTAHTENIIILKSQPGSWSSSTTSFIARLYNTICSAVHLQNIRNFINYIFSFLQNVFLVMLSIIWSTFLTLLSIISTVFLTSSSIISALSSVVKSTFSFMVIKPLITLLQLYRILVIVPLITFLVYIVEFLLIPINGLLMVFFDVNLFGLINHGLFQQTSNDYYFAFKNTRGTGGSGSFDNKINNFYQNINNIYNNHKQSNSKLYLKELRHGKLGTKFHDFWNYYSSGFGIGPSAAASSFQGDYNSTSQYAVLRDNIGVLQLLYLVYKFWIISILFGGLLAVSTSIGFLFTKVVVNQLTLKVLVHKTASLFKVLSKIAKENAEFVTSGDNRAAIEGTTASSKSFKELNGHNVSFDIDDGDAGIPIHDPEFLDGQILDIISQELAGNEEQYDEEQGAELGKRRPVSAVPMDASSSTAQETNDNEDEILADRYGNLEYLRNLNHSSGSQSTLDENYESASSSLGGTRRRSKPSSSSQSSSPTHNRSPRKDDVSLRDTNRNWSVRSNDSDYNSGTFSSSIFSTINSMNHNRIGSIEGSITEESEVSEDEK